MPDCSALATDSLQYWITYFASLYIEVPAGVTCNPRWLRSNNCNPRLLSSELICLITAGGEIYNFSAVLLKLPWGGIPWWSWVITSAFVGVVVGAFARKLNVQEGDFGKAKAAVFAIANVVAHVIGWVVVAPVLDILIYAEPAKKVFAQGAFAAVSNTITGVVVGGLLILAYTKTIAKKGSLDQE